MASVIIVGDGPGGLSAALFLAKNGHATMVFGVDNTAMNYAYLHNYLGITGIAGHEFQKRAKDQVRSFGAIINEAEVTEVSVDGGITVNTETGEHSADYLILTEGKNPVLASSLGLETDGDAIVVDRDFKTSLGNVYVVGRSARPERSQAIISAGAGAIAALDIMATEAGKNVQDWDTE